MNEINLSLEEAINIVKKVDKWSATPEGKNYTLTGIIQNLGIEFRYYGFFWIPMCDLNIYKDFWYGNSIFGLEMSRSKELISLHEVILNDYKEMQRSKRKQQIECVRELL